MKTTRISGAAALALALAGSLGLATAANAAPGDQRLAPTETEGSLTIHKYAGEPTDGNNSGVELTGADAPTADPLDGAGFTVSRVSCMSGTPAVEQLDLATNQGWLNAAELFGEVGSNPTATALTGVTSLGGVAVTCTLTQFGAEQLTGKDGNAAGVTVFEHMPLGLYYVSETTPVDGLKPVLPFLVTIPMTNPDNTAQWMYDVHVYPKDRPEATKTVVDAEVSSTEQGKMVTWTITSPAPYNPDGTNGYYMVDKLDPRLGFDQASANVTVWLGGAGVGSDGTEAVGFDAPTDYTVTPEVDTSVEPNVTTVRMELTAAGIAKLDTAVAANKALYMNWSFETTVSGTGPIENDATIFDNTPYDASNTCEAGDASCAVTEKATTKFGAVKVTKIANTDNQSGDSVPLAGAEFRVLASSSDNACTDGTDTGVSGTTNASGELYLQQLRVSDWANGVQLAIEDDSNGDPVVPDGWMYYCLEETKAPAGYELLPEGIPFQLLTGTDANTATITDDTVTPNVSYQFALGQTVKNVPSKAGFQLPLTGGIGTAIFLVIGAAVVGGSFAYARRENKKNAN